MTAAVALLPMKGHSERVPNKNVRPLVGQPLFYYVADTLLKAGLFECLCINTDSEQIASLASARYPRGWLVIHERPESLCGDDVPMNRIIENDLERLKGASRFLQTHSTNPFVTIETYGSALAQYIAARDAGHDSLFSVTEYKARFYDHKFIPINHDPRYLQKTQDLPPLYEENSCFYAFSYDSFAKFKNRIGASPDHFITLAGSYEFLDIDTEEQWRLAEFLTAGKRYQV